jgi:hypothetical protein
MKDDRSVLIMDLFLPERAEEAEGEIRNVRRET